MDLDLTTEELRRRLSGYDFEEGAVLVQIPQVPLELLDSQVARNRGYFAYPPQGLLYLSAVLRELRIKTRIIDLNFVILEEAQKETPDIEGAWQRALDGALADFRNPFVCVSFMFAPTRAYFKKICGYIRGRKARSCLAAGGVNAMVEAEEILKEGMADLVFSHEGEDTLRGFYAFTKHQDQGLPVNLSFVDSAGLIRHTPRVCGGNVDTDIGREYSLIPISRQHSVGSLGNYSRMAGIDRPFATLFSRRGCRGRCSFCGTRNFYGQGVRMRSNESVIREMELLYRDYGIRHFDWVDDDLLFNEAKALELFKEMAGRFPGISWAVNNGVMAVSLTPEMLRAMQQSGCVGFKVGLESGNAEILRKMRKPLTVEKFFAFAEMAQDFPRMHIAVNLIMGFPGETFAQMLDSYQVALRATLDWSNFYIYQPIKNTDLYSDFGKTGIGLKISSHGREAEGPAMNPVRGGVFKDYNFSGEVLSGYDIFDIDADSLPGSQQLKEIWFSINFIVNFLCLPALFTDSEDRLRHNIRWMEALSQAYPQDPAMTSLLYYLKRRLNDNDPDGLETLRSRSLSNIKKSRYWQHRDKQFKFSSFLDGVIPVVPERYLRSVTKAGGVGKCQRAEN